MNNEMEGYSKIVSTYVKFHNRFYYCFQEINNPSVRNFKNANSSSTIFPAIKNKFSNSLPKHRSLLTGTTYHWIIAQDCFQVEQSLIYLHSVKIPRFKFISRLRQRKSPNLNVQGRFKYRRISTSKMILRLRNHCTTHRIGYKIIRKVHREHWIRPVAVPS